MISVITFIMAVLCFFVASVELSIYIDSHTAFDAVMSLCFMVLGLFVGTAWRVK